MYPTIPEGAARIVEVFMWMDNHELYVLIALILSAAFNFWIVTSWALNVIWEWWAARKQ